MYTTKIHFNIILHSFSSLNCHFLRSFPNKIGYAFVDTKKGTILWTPGWTMKYSIRSLEIAQKNLNGNTGLNVIRSSIASIRTAPHMECSCCYQGKQTPTQIVINECLPWSTVHRRMGPNNREGNPSFGSMDQLFSFQASLVYKRVHSPRGIHSTLGRYILPVHGSHKPVLFMSYQSGAYISTRKK